MGGGGGDKASATAAPTASGLPAGWVEAFSNSKQKPYWKNAATGETTWVMPTGGGGDGGSDVAAAVSSGLPAGWSEAFSKSKNLPYWRHTDGTTSWSRPQ